LSDADKFGQVPSSLEKDSYDIDASKQEQSSHHARDTSDCDPQDVVSSTYSKNKLASRQDCHVRDDDWCAHQPSGEEFPDPLDGSFQQSSPSTAGPANLNSLKNYSPQNTVGIVPASQELLPGRSLLAHSKDMPRNSIPSQFPGISTHHVAILSDATSLSEPHVWQNHSLIDSQRPQHVHDQGADTVNPRDLVKLF
jgi:hypothetical protein